MLAEIIREIYQLPVRIYQGLAFGGAPPKGAGRENGRKMVDLGGKRRGGELLDPPDLSLISPEGVVLSLFMSCFALLVSWLFGSLKYSCYLCNGFERV